MRTPSGRKLRKPSNLSDTTFSAVEKSFYDENDMFQFESPSSRDLQHEESDLLRKRTADTIMFYEESTKPAKKLKGVRKRPWTQLEDVMLTKLVNRIGSQKWSEIAKRIKGREGKQCRERWHNHLNPQIRKDPWETNEEWLLF